LNSFHHGDTEIFTEAQRRDLFRQTLQGSITLVGLTQGSQSLALGLTPATAPQHVEQ